MQKTPAGASWFVKGTCTTYLDASQFASTTRPRYASARGRKKAFINRILPPGGPSRADGRACPRRNGGRAHVKGGFGRSRRRAANPRPAEPWASACETLTRGDERMNRFVEFRARVGGRDLAADPRRSARHHGVAEAHRVH